MRKKGKITALLGTVLLLSVWLGLRIWWDGRQPVTVQEITFFLGEEEHRRLKLWHNYYNNTEYLFLPAYCSQDMQVQVTMSRRGALSWDGQALGRQNLLYDLTEGTHYLQAGNTEFTVEVMRSASVPSLFLYTSSGSLSHIEAVKGNGEPALYEMVDADGEVIAAGAVSKLKSRGNSTFLEDKKPYQMTLEEGADLLDNGIQDKYILLANRQDQSLLRDRIMYDLAADMGLAYSAVSRFVDLYVNEEYRGSYQLSEKVETGHGRMALDTETGRTETAFLVTLEYPNEDRLAEAEHYFTTGNGQNVIIKRPAEPTDAQRAYIADTFAAVQEDIRAGRIEETRIDMTSFARKYLVEEIGKNLDAMYTSQYFYQDEPQKDGKLYAGPVWDYDKTLGNPLIERTRAVDFQEPRGIYAAMEQADATWWYDLYQLPAFRETMIQEYKETAVPAIEAMLGGKIDGYRDEIWNSAHMDYMRWDPFEDFKYEEELEFETSYQAEIDRIKEFLNLRRQFLDDIWLEGRKYDRITFDPGEGSMYVTYVDAIEGRTLNQPRDPKREGYQFDHWVREDTGEVYDFTACYDGNPFVLQAVYRPEEE